MTEQVLEGTWEEIASHSEELARSGKRLRLIIPADEAENGNEPPTPNFVFLEAMRKAREIQRGMNPKPGGDSVKLIREGRAGAMWGYDPCE